MSKFIWINASPSLKYFHRRLLNNLSKVVEIELWEYYQTLDESSSIDGGIDLLQEYLSKFDCPVHLIGHGIGGAIALGYARTYPTKIASLTLLSVAVQPGIDWHSYYYTQLRCLPFSQECTLRSTAKSLFPHTRSNHIQDLVDRLRKDLVESPSNNSLFRLSILPTGGVEMPMMICGGQDDPVITSSLLYGWANNFKSVDTIWCAATGGHFFHHFHPELVSDRIQHFWQKLEPQIRVHQLARAEFN